MKRFIILLLVTLSVISCTKKKQAKQVVFEYQYQVQSVNSGPLTIQVINSSGNLENFTGSSGWSLKWSKTVMVDEDNLPVNNAWGSGKQGLSILATDESLKSQSITVKILRQGEVVAQNTESNSSHSAKVDGFF